jgi:hypothetical protein
MSRRKRLSRQEPVGFASGAGGEGGRELVKMKLVKGRWVVGGRWMAEVRYWEIHFVDDEPIDAVEQGTGLRGFGTRPWHGPIGVVEQGTGFRVEALDASAVNAGADSRLDLAVADGADPYWCSVNCSIQ